MNAAQKITIQSQKVDPELLQDACDLFAGRRAGHMGKWMYSYPLYENDPVRGAELWAKVVEDAKNGSPYYVFNDERALIQKAAPVIASYITQNCSLVDLGPGSKDAFTGKIDPIIKTNSYIREYVGVDISTSILNDIDGYVQGTHPFLGTRTANADFFADAFRYPSSQPSELAVLFGLTLFNLCIDPRVPELPEMVLGSYLTRLGQHFRTRNGLLVITQDTNQDPELLAHAYATNKDYESTLLYRIPRDLPVAGDYDPLGFELVMKFHPETKAYSMSFQAQKSMNFSIGGEAFTVTAGDRFYFHNCFKLGAEDFVRIAAQSNLTHLKMIDDGNHTVLHILRSKYAHP